MKCFFFFPDNIDFSSNNIFVMWLNFNYVFKLLRNVHFQETEVFFFFFPSENSVLLFKIPSKC